MGTRTATVEDPRPRRVSRPAIRPGSSAAGRGTPLRPVVLAVMAAMAVGVLVAVAVAPPARADGDPASDVLLGENVFYPYTPVVSGPLQKQLNAATAAANRAGFPIKVALIASPIDLGVIPSLFNKPQRYADFLDVEISFQTKQQLLVVMPAGLGSRGLGPAATAKLKTLPKPAAAKSNDLAQAAITAVPALAAASGHPLPEATATTTTTSKSSGGKSGGSNGPLLIVLIVAAVATSAALVMGRRRQVRAARRRRASRTSAR